MENEEWRDIVGYEGLYEVSNIGRVRSVKKDVYFLKSFQRKKEIHYIYFFLSKNGVRKSYYCHRLVAQSFIFNFNNKPCVNHIDNNPENNKVENLEWCTQKENVYHALKQGRHSLINIINKKGETTTSAKLKEKDIFSIRSSNLLLKELAEIYKVNISAISKIKNRKTWNHI